MNQPRFSHHAAAEAPPAVAVLLSLYRAPDFLLAQLDSIAGQRGARWTLHWRQDDANADARRTMHRFAAQQPGRVQELTEDQGLHLGPGASFCRLLAAVPEGQEHVAFADQDDVWLPEKLLRACLALSRIPADTPALYCGRQRIVDAALCPIGLSPLPRRALGLANALVQNVATGCTVVLNAAARRLLLSIPPPADSLHDGWAYILVSAMGGKVIYDPEPLLLHRQHEANTVGAEPGLLRRAARALRRGPAPFLARLDAHLSALAAHRHELPAASLDLLQRLSETRHPALLPRLKALAASGVYRQRLPEELALWLWIAAHPVPRATASRLAPPDSAGLLAGTES